MEHDPYMDGVPHSILKIESMMMQQKNWNRSLIGTCSVPLLTLSPQGGTPLPPLYTY